ncbi:hypothetical protein [Amaricoccus sp. W119]|uniref:hypothetical protein n=1 Tax=Amaricoccus sp. W119 TaxID=3391833 RepID=UPI0039A58DB1
MALVVAAPLAIAACAAPPTDMSRVEAEVNTDLAQNGISGVDVTTLTLKQLQEIKLVAGSPADRASKQNQISAIINRAPGSQAD